MSAPRIALHLREGILPPSPTPAQGMQLLPYPATAAPDRLLEKVRAVEADLHVFADLIPSGLALQAMLRGLVRHNFRAAVTPNAAALGRLGYMAAALGGEGGAGVQIRACELLPSWCTVLPTALLEPAGFFDGSEETLDFRLLRVSRTLVAQGVPMVSIGTPFRELDEAKWARGLVLTLQQALARDFARCEDPAQVPHQLRVSLVGEDQPADMELAENGPKFSLLCPAFKPDFVEEMIQTVIAQRYPHWELLLLVDGPGDASEAAFREIFARYAHEPRVKPGFQANAGTGVTRERLCRRAEGDFLVFIDDDDTLHPECLARFAGALQAEPGLDVVRGGAGLFGVVERYLPPLPRVMVDGVSASLFEVTQPFAVRRAVVDSFGGLHGDPGFGGVGEDSDLFMRLDRAGARTRLINLPLYGRRLSTLNQSLNFGGGDFTEHVRTLIRRHAPPQWSLDGLTFNLEGGFVTQVASYKSVHGPQVLHCPTRYFNYNTLGE